VALSQEFDPRSKELRGDIEPRLKVIVDEAFGPR
jgi:hypothetical protein